MTSESNASSGSGDGSRILWSRWARVVATLLILWHLSAVVLAPLSVGASGGSPVWQAVSTPFWPYIEAADLNHGYRFFSPDPGPSHLIRYRLEMPDGSRRDGVIPSLADERPRLLYHRYFMLTEHLNSYYSPGIPEPMQRANEAIFHILVRSYADELLHRTGAKAVHMELIEHELPSPDDVLNGKRLNDPKLYRIISDLGTFTEHSP